MAAAQAVGAESCGGVTTPSASRCAAGQPRIAAAFARVPSQPEVPGRNGLLVDIYQNRIDLEYRFTNSLAGNYPAPSIDGTMSIRTSDDGSVHGGYERNAYPSLEIYQDAPGNPVPIRKSYSGESHGPLFGLDDNLNELFDWTTKRSF